MRAQVAEAEILWLVRGRHGLRSQYLDGEFRKGACDIAEQARPLGRRRCSDELRRRNELAMHVPGRQTRLVHPVGKEEDGEDQMQHQDRDDHQRRDLSADGLEVQKLKLLHGQTFATGATASTLGVKTYPPERTVLISVASCGSGSILRRMRLTSTSIERSNEPALRPCVRSSKLSRDSTRPGRSQKVCSRSNSALVIATRAPSGLRSSRRRRSICQPWKDSAAAPSMVEALRAACCRRSTALMRASSSRGLKGFGM